MPMDPNCSCDVICAECQDEEIDFHFGEEDDDDWIDDDLCCFDPRYKHGDYCHCKARAEQFELEQKLWYRAYTWALYQINRLQDFVTTFRQNFLTNKDKSEDCEDDLPF